MRALFPLFMDYRSFLSTQDPAIAAALSGEEIRQTEGMELIASENYVSPAVLAALGSIFTNKYSEGYPGKRYYGGQTYTDQIEQLAIDRAKQLFPGANFANVQPHSGVLPMKRCTILCWSRETPFWEWI